MASFPWHKHYDPDVPRTIDYPAVSIDSFLREAAAEFPDNPALIFYGRKISYATLDLLVERFATGLQRLGVKKGDRVSLFLPNCPQLVIAYYAVWRLGAIAVATNALYVAREVSHQLLDSGARFMVCLSSFYETATRARRDTPLERIVVTNIKEYFPAALRIFFTLLREKRQGHRVRLPDGGSDVWFQELLSPAADHAMFPEVGADDPAVLMYTGGTTGVPKAAVLLHRNLVANALQASAWNGRTARRGSEIMLTALPMTHSYSLTVCMNQAVYNGWAQILIPDPRDLTGLLKAINKFKPTIFPGVPALYTAINNHHGVTSGKYRIGSIRICISGAAGLPPEVQREFQRLTGGKLVEGYGLSEASPVVSANPLQQGDRIGTIGLPFPDTAVKIVDEETETRTLRVGETGVLCVSGPQVMQGYWNRPEETARVLRRDEHGKVWLHTGDMARMDKDGYLQIVDRKKDIILAGGGLKVFPREVEDVLYAHPKILHAAVIGVPVHAKNQRTKAFIVLRPGQQATVAEILAYCKENLAPFRVPKYIEFRRELPMSPIGKVLRRELIRQEAEKETGEVA